MPKFMEHPWRRIGLVVLTALGLILTYYSMPGIFSIVSFASAFVITLISILFLSKRGIGEKPPITILALILLVPFVVGAIVFIEGLRTWFSILQVFVAWGLTVTFWFNFLMVPLAVYHAHLEQKRKDSAFIYPPITVIVPAYNEEKVIEPTIEALIEADYPAPKEVIIVDDGSTDRTAEIARRYSSKYRWIKVFSKPNGGKYSAINYGLLFSRNPIIVTIDADTVIGRDALKEIIKPFENPEVAGVAGNILVLNKKNILTKSQAVEYILSINIMRRAMDIFGTVPVVPGVLGAFRRKIIESVGNYDPDTVTEDFDITVKNLKAGKIVQASSSAVAYTEAPETVRDLYHQRIRWYRGNTQTVLKHRDIPSTKRYGILRALTYPFILMNLFIIPFLTFPVWLAAIASVTFGYWQEITLILLLFIVLEMLHTALALDLSGEEKVSLILYAPLLVVGYKHLIDGFTVKAVIDTILGREKGEWTRAKRYGAAEKVKLVAQT